MENIQILCIFQTPLEKAMCAIRRKSDFFRTRCGIFNRDEVEIKNASSKLIAQIAISISKASKFSIIQD
jgi:hypothetical protein